jgi:hypothetical protein
MWAVTARISTLLEGQLREGWPFFFRPIPRDTQKQIAARFRAAVQDKSSTDTTARAARDFAAYITRLLRFSQSG